MGIVAVYFGDMRICDDYEGQVLKRLDPVGESCWKDREGEVGGIEELIRGERRTAMSRIQSVEFGSEKRISVLC